ncbi:hypothetical protein GCM10027347_17920 [Larkinella harenae]
MEGRVLDEATGQPVEFAYVSIAGKAWGTLANAEGYFLLKYPKIDAQKKLTISAVGYRNGERNLTDLSSTDTVQIRLKTATKTLVSTSLREPEKARSLVLSAWQSISANFQTTPTVLNGFYREMLSVDTTCWQVREAVLKVEKLPNAKTEWPEKVKLIRGRQRAHQPLPKMLDGYAFPNGAALVTRSMELGPPDYLSGQHLNDYEFRLDSLLTEFDNRPAYRMQFVPVAGRRVRAARTGEILIDTASRAVVRLAYEFTPEAAGEVLKTSLKSVFDNLTGRSKKEVKRVASHSQYRQLNGKWFLQDSRLVLETQFVQAASQSALASIQLHFVTTEYGRSNGQAVRETELLTTTENLPRQPGTYDERFWGHFNTVFPTKAEQLNLKN